MKRERGPKESTVHSHPTQDFAIRTTRLRHRFTTFWRVARAIHYFGRFCRARFTTWTLRFTSWFTSFGREKAQMAISVQRSPFSRYVPLLASNSTPPHQLLEVDSVLHVLHVAKYNNYNKAEQLVPTKSYVVFIFQLKIVISQCS